MGCEALLRGNETVRKMSMESNYMDQMPSGMKIGQTGTISADLKWCGEYCRKHWPEECDHILRIADDAVKGRFLFDLPWDMEQTVKAVEFHGEIDWQYMPEGDPEFIYQFNRHRYWICLGQAYAMTGDGRYAACFVRQLMSWIEKNPITEETKKTTWRTIEAGIRGENWVKAMGYFKDSAAVTDEVKETFARGLRLHGDYLMECRVPFSDKSNWGVLESHGLFDIGAALGDNGEFGGWSDGCGQTGVLSRDYICEALRRLERELSIQIMDDGVHWEQSPMYHNEVLRCVLEVLRMARRHDIALPQVLEEKAADMAMADLAWMKPDRTQPMGGDSDRTDLRDVFTPAAYLLKDEQLRYVGYDCLDFESVWELGPEAVMEYNSMRGRKCQRLFDALEHSGNWCLRSDWGTKADYLHFKCGSLGGGHGHFDKLHVDLSIGGEDVLIDSGRYTYVDGRLRRQLKSACAHNVPVADWSEYTQCAGSWDVKGTTPAAGQQWCRKGPYTFLSGTHFGYLPDSVLAYRRIISIGTRIHVIADGFYGGGSHVCSQLFHLNPKGKAELSDRSFTYRGQYVNADFTVLTDKAHIESEDGPVSFHYNELEYGPCVSVWKEDSLFLPILTVITGYESDAVNPYTIEKVPVTAPVTGRQLNDREAEAVRIRENGHSWLVVINHHETGADSEYIGAAGCYGLGRVMVCDEAQSGGRMTACNDSEQGGLMTVLQW